MATSDADTLLGLAKAHHVDAVRLLENPDSRTTQSVLSTFQAHMHVVATLADGRALIRDQHDQPLSELPERHPLPPDTEV